MLYPCEHVINVITEFNDSKWRMLYGGSKLKKLLYFYKMSILRILGSLNPNLILEFQNSEWRIQYGRSKV